ncbi:G-protein-signaling modulator 2 [Cichlidogyrus casuarinus]|uniref:G-protein-signaling modulator 2 n=1 Tax=Cichlidogyrus casuarinus TaxID=1844966 RepID=A0ABD2Q1H2_9PLAT
MICSKFQAENNNTLGKNSSSMLSGAPLSPKDKLSTHGKLAAYILTVSEYHISSSQMAAPLKKNSCRELALEGEKLCRLGEYSACIGPFMAALCLGTDDPKLISSIYSQLGNAYFYLNDYLHALEYHKLDLSLTRKMNDLLGEAKASGNLGNTLKLLGQYDEAILCCQRHLDIVRQLKDKVFEARALYNLGSTYYAKGKRFCKLEDLIQTTKPESRLGMEFISFPQESKDALKKAIDCYSLNLTLVKELNDKVAEGRAYNNIANCHYVLGNFEEAFRFYQMKMKIAREFGNSVAELLAHVNMAHCLIFTNSPRQAIVNYQSAYKLARRLDDAAALSTLCFHLGHACSIIGQYLVAAVYHLRQVFLAISRSGDQLTCARGLISLSNAYLGEFDLFSENHQLNEPFSKKFSRSLLQFSILNAVRHLSKIQLSGKSEGNQQLVIDLLRTAHSRFSYRSLEEKQSELEENCYEQLLPAREEDVEAFVERMLQLACAQPEQDFDFARFDATTLQQETTQTLNMIKSLNEWKQEQATEEAASSNAPAETEADSLLLLDDLKDPVHADATILILNEAGDRCTSYPPSSECPTAPIMLIESYDSSGKRLLTRAINPSSTAKCTHYASSVGQQASPSTEDLDRFFNLLVQCQSRRLNEQRCALNTLNELPTRSHPFVYDSTLMLV